MALKTKTEVEYYLSKNPKAKELAKKNLNTNIFDNGDNTFTMHAHIGHIHFKDKKTKTFEDIDTKFIPTIYGWEMRKANYELEIPEYADSWFKFINSFVLDPRTDLEHGLPDEKFGIKPLEVRHIKGQLATEGDWAYKSILYKEAYNQDIDLLVQARNVAFDKLIRINKKPADLSQDLQFGFQIGFSDDTKILLKKGIRELTIEDKEKIIALKKKIGTYIKNQIIQETKGNYEEARKLVAKNKEALDELEDNIYRKLWDKITTIKTSESTILGKLKKTWFRDFKVWDSEGNIDTCNVKLVKKDSKFYLIKTISKEFLANAVYPVYSDTTTSYYAGAGDGTVKNHGSGWNTIHDAATGSYVTYVATMSTSAHVSEYDGATSYSIYRGFFPINTSGLPDAAIISAALLKLDVTLVDNGDDDGDDYLVVVQTDQPSTSALTTADYNNCGTIDNPAEGSDQKDLTGLGTGYKTWTLNGTGIGWISKTSWTKLGLREGHDCLDHAVAASTASGIKNYWSEQADTTHDPYLEVTYTVKKLSPASNTAALNLLLGV